MVEKKLQFSDLREARAVLGMKDEFLKTMQREFPDCRIAVRGDTAMIVGSEEDVAYVTEVFRVLRYLFRENTYLTTQHVRYSARLIKEGQSEALHNLYEDTVGISARGRLIKPKTLGQKRYVDSIRKNLVTFGIGPAGTGKTYLAVALAAFYLQASVSALIDRLEAYPKAEQRPTLTGKPVREEVGEVLAQREALYRDAAHHIVDATASPDRVVEQIMSMLCSATATPVS